MTRIAHQYKLLLKTINSTVLLNWNPKQLRIILDFNYEVVFAATLLHCCNTFLIVLLDY